VWFVEHDHICTMLILYPFNQLFPLQDCVTKQTIYQLTHKLSPLTFLPKFFTFQNLMCKRSIRYFILSIYIPSSSQLHSLFHVSTVASKYLYQYSIPTSFQHFLLSSFIIWRCIDEKNIINGVNLTRDLTIAKLSSSISIFTIHYATTSNLC